MSHEEKRSVPFLKSTLFAVLLVSCTAFTGPGMFGALNGLGAGGGAKPEIANAANAIVFGVIALFSIVVGAISNRISPKISLLIGTLGYTPYAAGLYCSDRFDTTWLLLFGAVSIGISGSFLWVGSGAILLGYSEENRKGTAMSIKFAFQHAGAMVGGIISLALNVERDYLGGVTQSTYIALMTIMCLGWPFALLLPKAKSIQRTDGCPVIVRKQPSLISEFRVLKGIFSGPVIWAILPLMLYAQWFLSFQWQFNYAYFTVRARALNSFLFYLLGLLGALAFGQLLDNTRFQRTTRARIGFYIITIVTGTSWILGQIVQVKYNNTLPTFDWASDGYGLGAATFCLWGLSDPLISTYMFWLVGSFSNDLNETSFLAGIMNSVGSVGSTFGFVVSTFDVPYNWACAINLILFFISIPPLAFVVFTRVTNSTHGTNLSGLKGDSSSKTEEGDAYVETNPVEYKEDVK